MQEAGVLGEVENVPLSAFMLAKNDRDRDKLGIQVRVFALAVTSELLRWPEDHMRERRWLSIKAAIKLVDDPGIRTALRQLRRKVDATG